MRKKTILIMLVTTHLLRLKVVPVKSVEKLVGLWGWVLIFCRWGYSVVGETYRFLRAHPDDAWRPLPP